MAAVDRVGSVVATSYQSQASQSAKPIAEAQPVNTDSAQAMATQTPVVQQVSADNNGGMQGGYKNEQSEEKRIEQDNEKVKKAVNDLNKKMTNTTAQFGIHEGTGRVTIKIVDKDTKDVLKEFPAEETLDMIQKAWELAGLMVDKKL